MRVDVTKASLTHAIKKLKYFEWFFSSSFPFWFSMENYCPYITWSHQNCFTCYKFRGRSKIKVRNVANSQKERKKERKKVKLLLHLFFFRLAIFFFHLISLFSYYRSCSFSFSWSFLDLDHSSCSKFIILQQYMVL